MPDARRQRARARRCLAGEHSPWGGEQSLPVTRSAARLKVAIQNVLPVGGIVPLGQPTIPVSVRMRY